MIQHAYESTINTGIFNKLYRTQQRDVLLCYLSHVQQIFWIRESVCVLRWCTVLQLQLQIRNEKTRQEKKRNGTYAILLAPCVHTQAHMHACTQRNETNMVHCLMVSKDDETTQCSQVRAQFRTPTTKIKLISNLQIYDFNNPFDLAACYSHLDSLIFSFIRWDFFHFISFFSSLICWLEMCWCDWCATKLSQSILDILNSLKNHKESIQLQYAIFGVWRTHFT